MEIWLAPDAREDWATLTAHSWAGSVAALQWYGWRLYGSTPSRLDVPLIAEVGAVKEWAPDGRAAAADLQSLLARWGSIIAGCTLDEPLAAARALGLTRDAAVDGVCRVIEAAGARPVGLVEWVDPSALADLIAWIEALDSRVQLAWVHLDIDAHLLMARRRRWWWPWCARRRRLGYAGVLAAVRTLLPLLGPPRVGLLVWASGSPDVPIVTRGLAMLAVARRAGVRRVIVQSWDGIPLSTLQIWVDAAASDDRAAC